MSNFLTPVTLSNRSAEQENDMENAIETENAYELIAIERARQDAKWGVQNHHGSVWALIASEEFGEVSEAQLELMFKGSQKLQDGIARKAYLAELIQLTAVCVAWLECELRRDEAKS